MSSKSDNHLSYFFVERPDQKFLLTQSLLGGIHSSASPQFSRISPRLDWKALFVKLPKCKNLSSKSDNHLSTFFVEQPDQKFLLTQSLLGGIHSSASPQFSRISPRLDWKALFVKLPKCKNLSSKSDNHLSNFIVEQPDQKFLLLQNLIGEIRSSTSPQFSKISPRLDWKTLFVKLPKFNF